MAVASGGSEDSAHHSTTNPPTWIFRTFDGPARRKVSCLFEKKTGKSCRPNNSIFIKFIFAFSRVLDSKNTNI